MFLGHYAVALAAKRAAPRVSMGWLFAGAQFADLLWPLLLLTGLETVEITPGITEFTPLDFTSYPISHSLLALIGWGALLGGLYHVLRRDLAGALIVGLLVPSHWILDAVVHRPDLPLLPGVDLRVGMGLWNSVTATLFVEAALFAAGILLYSSFTRARDVTGRWAFVAFVIVLAGLYAATALGPPPPDLVTLAASALALGLTVAWGAWFDRHRSPLVR